MWCYLDSNNQVRTKNMQSTLFTELTAIEEANLSGGGRKRGRGGHGGGHGGGGVDVDIDIDIDIDIDVNLGGKKGRR
ncbi:hypothetical protein [Nostoc sp.]|uniref:hypothetical protein n=1 Tax=Nostoc sp. TaxID=1180 RepID=UPI002FFA4BEC